MKSLFAWSVAVSFVLLTTAPAWAQRGGRIGGGASMSSRASVMGQMHTNPVVLKPHSPDIQVKGDLPQGATIKSPKTKTSNKADANITSAAGKSGANLGAGANAQSGTNTKPVVLKPHSPDLDVNGNLPQGATIQSPKTKTGTNSDVDVTSAAGKSGANLGAGANTQTQMNNNTAAGGRNVGASAHTSGRASSNNTMNVTPANANISSASHASAGARLLTKLHLKKSH